MMTEERSIRQSVKVERRRRGEGRGGEERRKQDSRAENRKEERKRRRKRKRKRDEKQVLSISQKTRRVIGRDNRGLVLEGSRKLKVRLRVSGKTDEAEGTKTRMKGRNAKARKPPCTVLYTQDGVRRYRIRLEEGW